MRSRRDSNRWLYLRKDAIRRNFWDGAAYPKGAMGLAVERALSEFQRFHFLLRFLKENNQGRR